jgi:hypothetical protein
MSKIEDPQDTEGERKARGDQKEQCAPGDSTHELVEENVKRHNLPKIQILNVAKIFYRNLPHPPLAEAVKKFAWIFFPSFRRKPESSIFKPLRTAWTPVFTGVTTKRKFFHTFSGGEGWGGGAKVTVRRSC